MLILVVRYVKKNRHTLVDTTVYGIRLLSATVVMFNIIITVTNRLKAVRLASGCMATPRHGGHVTEYEINYVVNYRHTNTTASYIWLAYTPPTVCSRHHWLIAKRVTWFTVCDWRLSAEQKGGYAKKRLAITVKQNEDAWLGGLPRYAGANKHSHTVWYQYGHTPHVCRDVSAHLMATTPRRGRYALRTRCLRRRHYDMSYTLVSHRRRHTTMNGDMARDATVHETYRAISLRIRHG